MLFSVTKQVLSIFTYSHRYFYYLPNLLTYPHTYTHTYPPTHLHVGILHRGGWWYPMVI